MCCVVLQLLVMSGVAVVDGQAASISLLQPMNGPPTGGFTLTVIGVDLASGDLSFGIRVGGTSCESTTWTSSSSMACRIGAGYFPSNVVTATVRFRADMPKVEVDTTVEPCPCVTFTFDKPSLADPTDMNGPTVGDTTVTLRGKNFAIMDVSPRVRFGFTAGQFTTWMSDTAVLTRNSQSVLEFQSTVITSQLQKETRFNQFSYDRPEISAVNLTNSRTAGGGTMTVVGKGFGHVDLTQRLRLGSSSCLATGWMSGSTVLCKLPADTNSNLRITFSVERNYVFKESVMSYDDPLITAIHPTNVPVTQAKRVSLFGFNFGGQVHDPRSGRLGDTACLAMQWVSDTTISCLSQPGYAADLFVTVTIAQVQNQRRLMSYNSPRITALFSSNGPASGSTEFRIFGNSFGAFELTPQLKVGPTLCMRTQWEAESSMLCKAPRVDYDKWFLGGNVPVRIILGSSSNTMRHAYTYDMACVGPCVIGLACSSSTGGFGCNGPTHGDYRHPINKDIVDFKGFDGKHVVRVIGNFTLYRPNINVIVGNSTQNRTVQASEHIYNDDINVTFGDLYRCVPLAVPRVEALSTSQQYLDCVMPVGVGHGHEIKVTIRNATYKALLDGCTQDMKDIPVLPDNPSRGIWPPLLRNEAETPGRKFGNCLLPTSIDEEMSTADDIGVSFSYSAPAITHLMPKMGLNSLGETANVTLTGSNFGGEARRVWAPQCRISQSRSCRLLFENSVAFFNTSCSDINVLLTPSTGGAMEKQEQSNILAYCKTNETYMIKCQDAFSKNNEQCEAICPAGTLFDDDPAGLCRVFCSETQLVCQTRAIGGLQQVNVVVGDQAGRDTQTFAYKPPMVFSVHPPELASGTSSQLTVLGINIGVDMAAAYAGRMYASGANGVKIQTLDYNPSLVPFNTSSIKWWEYAQYSSCFSSQTLRRSAHDLDERVQQALDQKAQALAARVCDRGRVNSEQMILTRGSFLGTAADQVVIQGPAVQLDSTQTVVSVDVILISFGQRSETANATLRFRASCAQIAPQIATLSTLWYQGTGRFLASHLPSPLFLSIPIHHSVSFPPAANAKCAHPYTPLCVHY